MAKLSYGIFLLTVLLIMVGVVGRLFVFKVSPDRIGVRTQEFGLFGSKGIHQADYIQPGWYRSFWFIDKWYTFDKRVQTLRMFNPLGSPLRGSEGPSLQIKSKDGYDVIVNLRVKYRIQKGHAHKLLAKLGSDESRYRNLVANESTDACRIEFGEMRTEGFYNPTKRAEAAEKVQKRLQAKLNGYHLEVVDILISEIKFNESYEQKIKSKKLADQEVEVSKSRGIAAEFKGQTRVVEAETSAKLKEITAGQELEISKLRGTNQVAVTEILEDARSYSVQKKADADLLLQKAKAESQLLIKGAEAAGEKARVQAMSGPGGRVMVALEAARNLTIQKVDFSTLGTDALDVERMAEKLGAR